VKRETLNTVGLRGDGGCNPHAVSKRRDCSLREERPGIKGILEMEIGVMRYSLRRIVRGLDR